MTKGIAFDLEGTVVDVEEAHHKGHLAVAAEVGVILDLEGALKAIPHFIGGPDEKIMEEIYELGNKKRTLQEMLAWDKFFYNEALKTMTIAPRPGFLEVFKAFEQKGVPMAIGSLTSSDQARILLDRSGLTKLFKPEHIILKEDVKNLKPAPDVFLKTAERMGINPADQLVFEDSPRGVEAAKKAGSRAIGMPVYFDNPAVVKALVEAGAEKVFDSWEKIDPESLL